MYYEQLYANKFENLSNMEKFLEKHNQQNWQNKWKN